MPGVQAPVLEAGVPVSAPRSPGASLHPAPALGGWQCTEPVALRAGGHPQSSGDAALSLTRRGGSGELQSLCRGIQGPAAAQHRATLPALDLVWVTQACALTDQSPACLWVLAVPGRPSRGRRPTPLPPHGWASSSRVPLRPAKLGAWAGGCASVRASVLTRDLGTHRQR